MRFNTTITKTIANGVLGVALLSSTLSLAQKQDAIVDAIVKEGTTNSQLKNYAFELMDVIGPRLVGTPQMMQAHNWVKDQYASMGFESRNEEYGTWKAWERGTTQITMTSPRIKSLEGMQFV